MYYKLPEHLHLMVVGGQWSMHIHSSTLKEQASGDIWVPLVCNLFLIVCISICICYLRSLFLRNLFMITHPKVFVSKHGYLFVITQNLSETNQYLSEKKYCLLFADLLFPRICVQTSPTCELTRELNTSVKTLKLCTLTCIKMLKSASVDSIALSLFTNRSDAKVQITYLILRRKASSMQHCNEPERARDGERVQKMWNDAAHIM